MGVRSIIQRAREKQKAVETAEEKEQRARDRVRKAVTKIQLESARERLKTATLERKTREAEARTVLEKAKSEESRAKAERWKSKHEHVSAIFGGGGHRPKGSGKAVKTLAKGGERFGRWLTGTETPTRRKTVKRKAASHKR